MAGYFIYSIDSDAFANFVKAPDSEILAKFGEHLDDAYEDFMDELEEGDVAGKWCSEADNPAEAIVAHLKLPDWYSGLSVEAQQIWENALSELLTEHPSFRFEVVSDPVYWDVIEVCKKHIGKPSTESAIARFGTCPWSLTSAEANQPESWDMPFWQPMHSLHSVEEVKQMIAECQSAEEAVEASGNDEARREFNDALMPALESIAKANRMLFVSVDT